MIGNNSFETMRIYTIKSGMEFEAKTGIKLTKRAPSCFTIVRKEFGFKGNKEALYKQFCQRYNLEEKPNIFPAKALIK